MIIAFTVEQSEIFRMGFCIFFLGNCGGMVMDEILFGTVEIIVVGNRVKQSADGTVVVEKTGFVSVAMPNS